MTLSDYRTKHGLSLEAFGRLVGRSKSQIHAVEQRNYATAKLANAIERATDGAVSAALINPDIAEARRAA